MRSRLAPLTLALVATTQVGDTKPAQSRRMPHHQVFRPAPGDAPFGTPFQVLAPLPQMEPHSPSRAARSATSLAHTPHGILSFDEETATLALLNDELKVVASKQVGKVGGKMSYDAKGQRAFAVDRNGDRVAVVPVQAGSLGKVQTFATAEEPFAVAVHPSGDELYVVSVAGRKLQAFHAQTFELRWEKVIGPEARGLSISPSGKDLVVSFLSSSSIARVSLGASPRLRFVPIGATENSGASVGFGASAAPRHARNAFATTFIGETAVVAFQQSTPHAAQVGAVENTGRYGGGQGNPPIMQRIAFVPKGLADQGRVHLQSHLPRAIMYRAQDDALFVADLGLDNVTHVRFASKPWASWTATISLNSGQERCGPDGMDFDDSGNLLINCSLSKRVMRVDAVSEEAASNYFALATQPTRQSEVIASSPLSAEAQRGRAMFHKGSDTRLSDRGALACASCHPEGRADGLSWRIEGKTLQTPLLAGRMVGTHPFKWDGGDKDLHTSLMHTVVRLGGSGITQEDAKDLQAYLEALPKVRVAAPSDDKAVARGKKLFHNSTVGCAKCHNGKNYTDGNKYDLADSIENGVDTPSLLGLAASAPYYHDGSAATLKDLLRENASVHGMGGIAKLSDAQTDDLVAYLETL